jgi:hypothetical protein
MSTAVMRSASGATSYSHVSSITSSLTMMGCYAASVVFPLGAAAAPTSQAPVSAEKPTVSVTQLDRFATPAGLMFEAFRDAAAYAAEVPSEQAAPSAKALREACNLLLMLPPDTEAPEPVVEPGGALSWLWDRGASGFLVLAVDGKGRLQRSAVIDGVESWDTSALAGSFAAEETALLRHFRVSHA